MVRTWVSGSKNTDVIDKLRQNIADLETKRERLIDVNKTTVFEWASRTVRSNGDRKAEGRLTKQVMEIMAEYDSLNQAIVEKEVSLSERLDEQTKLDSLG